MPELSGQNENTSDVTDIAMVTSKSMNTNMVTLNGVSVIDPSKLQWGLMAISPSDSGRDQGGVMHDDIIGYTDKYELAWNMIDPINASIILQAVTQKRFFEATLFDPLTCTMRTSVYYAGDLSTPFQQWIPDRQDGKIYTQLAFNIIERGPRGDTYTGGGIPNESGSESIC